MNPRSIILSLVFVLIASSTIHAGSSFWGGFTGSLAGQAVGGIGKAIVHDTHCHKPCHYRTHTVVVEEEPVVVEKVVQKPVIVEKRVIVDQTQVLKEKNTTLEDDLYEERLKNKKLQKQLAHLEEKMERLEKKLNRTATA